MRKIKCKYRIYLAGPEVFLPNAKVLGERKKKLCSKYGFEGVYPLDAEFDKDGLTPYQIGSTISIANENLIISCQLLIANITPFRSPSADVGTAFELGFARGYGLKIYGYSNTNMLFEERTRQHIKLCKKLKVDVWGNNDNRIQIEKFNMIDNLMIDGSINSCGSKLIVSNASKNQLYTYLGNFEKCLSVAAKNFNILR